ncbi:tetraacyldisaccharide 4'-kinase [Alphaproteobacteria bacterium]|nr:tetraacyldisaccharide 4'-kinase [Alphaproteobacteria bacterium]
MALFVCAVGCGSIVFLKPPKFWYAKEASFFQKIFLSPFSAIYSFVSSWNYKRSYKCKLDSVKVIAIGAITVGGSGKSIVTAAIADIFKDMNKKAAVLSRGYGRSSDETIAVDANVHTYQDIGDEPLMLSKKGMDVYVSKDRSKSTQMAMAKEQYDAFILDDGLCQRYLQPNVRFLVIDVSQGFGNGEMLPLGPNRLDFEAIKDDIDAVILISGCTTGVTEKNAGIYLSRWQGHLCECVTHQDFSNIDCNKQYIAFCGLGYPRKFFDSLRKKLSVEKEVEFPDHYPYSEKDIVDLLDEAHTLNAKIITTEKDLARIPKKFHHLVTTVPVKIIWGNKEEIEAYLR